MPRRVESSGSIKVSEVAAMPLKCLTMQNKLHLRCSIMHVYSMSMIMFALLPDPTRTNDISGQLGVASCEPAAALAAKLNEV